MSLLALQGLMCLALQAQHLACEKVGLGAIPRPQAHVTNVQQLNHQTPGPVNVLVLSRAPAPPLSFREQIGRAHV